MDKSIGIHRVKINAVNLLFSGFLSRHYVEGASLSYMENNLRNYFSKTRHHDVGPDYKDRAKIFIRDEFQRLGLQTELQEFPDIRVSIR